MTEKKCRRIKCNNIPENGLVWCDECRQKMRTDTLQYHKEKQRKKDIEIENLFLGVPQKLETAAGFSEGKPTNVLPGSKEKVKIIAKRYQNGEQLFHPEDGDHDK